MTLTALISISSARADDPVAEPLELYRQGSAAFERGDYRIAGLAFEAACAKAPRGRTALSAGLAWEAAGDAPRAADNFTLALKLGELDPAERSEAEAKRLLLEQRLGRLSVVGAGWTASVAHVEKRSTPFIVHVEPGKHELVFNATDGSTQRLFVEVLGGGIREVSPTARELSVAKPVAPPGPTTPAPAPLLESSDGDVQRVFGASFAAVAGATTVATAVLGGLTLSKRAEYEETGFRDVELYEEGVALRTWTNVSLGASIGLSVLGTILLVTAPSSTTSSIRPTSDGLAFRFH